MERPRRSLLFTPANRPAAFGTALQSGADIVCIDLEDAVPANQKEQARVDALVFLAGAVQGTVQRALRINALSSRAGIEDLAAIARLAPTAGMVMLPKVNDAAELRLADAILSEAASAVELAAIIETLEGLDNVSAIARSTDRLKLVIFGAVDFSAELGTENASEPLQYARGKIIHAAKRAAVDVMDVPSLDFQNLDALTASARQARQLGFTGKAAIHPKGVDAINAAFTPSAAEIEHAKRVIAAFEASPNGLAVLDGQLIELPVVKAMQRKLAVAAVVQEPEAGSDD